MNGLGRRDFIKLGISGALSGAGGYSFSSSTSEEVFTDRTKEAGIDFFHFNGMTGAHYYPEVIGSGVALFDYDNDGDLDIFFVQGSLLGPNHDPEHAVFPPQMPLRGKLYRNDSIRHSDGSVALKFTDVTEQSGIRALGYSMGVAARGL
jgi:enediyne biosynthesis protein E4